MSLALRAESYYKYSCEQLCTLTS